ncbi:flagellar basal-body MS-ring/collar protein FliF [Robertmurraya sp. DFI.2.37]|uniref:flagellar basal-body MS-ring/collar protein FliF n=1 Tax=Robertmurraya sp. DFI.2.37 TaxID=3031819 RepID=UPI001248E9B9|nr:flagellar basal-body MS-ring/collar protein FliF [Robertmurraya sp. DFI.2.37]MDF1506591.1 flagellar basal-body MS-ring/collar protein FliF [Robertmurraya sp. DFI.2.37]
MTVSFQKYINNLKEYWNGRSKQYKMIIIGSILLGVIILSLVIFFTTRSNMVPLYKDLSLTEIGTIKENLDGKGIKYEISDGGTTISVPQEQADSLKVELAAEGLPKTGGIDYSFFSQNAGIGMTDNEFNVMKLDAMQTELANLIKGVEGVRDARVMITLPTQGIFVNDANEEATAAIILNTVPGYQFEEKQINALYHLVSKSVPNLPTDNIVISNQNFEYFDLKNNENSSGDTFTAQNDIKKEIERDVQRQVQSMLGTLMGQDKVVVSVTADIDFTKENREENLVTPVDEENMEGIAVSAQKITETFTGNGAGVGGVPAAEDPADTLGGTYQEGAYGNGDYERIEETINNEVNKIRREIIESPYKIRDLGIQVMVEPPIADDESSLPQERVDDITRMLSTIVRTTINKDTVDGELTDEDIQDKVVVSVQPFNGKQQFNTEPQSAIPWWVYVLGGVLLLIIIVLIFLFVRARKKREEEEMEEFEEESQVQIPDVNEEQETEGSLRRKQLEKMAKENPEDFAKLLRTWISED